MCAGAYIIVAHTFEVGHSHLTGTSSSSYLKFYGMGICLWAYCCWYQNWSIQLTAALLIICAGTYIRVDEKIGIICAGTYIYCLLLPLICLSAAAYRWEWRRREVCYNLNVVCRAFHIGHFTAGLFSCLVCVNCIDTRVSFPSFGGFSLLLFCCCRHSREYRN